MIFQDFCLDSQLFDSISKKFGITYLKEHLSLADLDKWINECIK